ncbi:hypothetical protein [Roseivirga sp.]|uniref:hypothetical protein n=1 Tax=Roseivirga sp. TaxID=1964215 RepID=UPI003B8C1750
MRKLVSKLMVAAAMVVMINPLSASSNNCEWEPGLETVLYGRCIRLLATPSIPGGDYCDTSFGENGADCTKSHFWF